MAVSFSNASTNISSNSWQSFSFSGTNGIVGSWGNGGIRYTTNSGINWN